MYNNSKMRDYRYYGQNYDTLMRQHDVIRNDLHALKSQVYEVCQQSNADRSLCDRIRSSINTVPLINNSKAAILKNDIVDAAAIVVDASKY
jgi:3-dehydroquinate dehydratase